MPGSSEGNRFMQGNVCVQSMHNAVLSFKKKKNKRWLSIIGDYNLRQYLSWSETWDDSRIYTRCDPQWPPLRLCCQECCESYSKSVRWGLSQTMAMSLEATSPRGWAFNMSGDQLVAHVGQTAEVPSPGRVCAAFTSLKKQFRPRLLTKTHSHMRSHLVDLLMEDGSLHGNAINLKYQWRGDIIQEIRNWNQQVWPIK